MRMGEDLTKERMHSLSLCPISLRPFAPLTLQHKNRAKGGLYLSIFGAFRHRYRKGMKEEGKEWDGRMNFRGQMISN